MIIKKYRSLGILAIGLFFNLATSIMFAEPGLPFNKSPLSVGEWISDIISILVIVFAMMMMVYDLYSHKPKKITTYKRVDGEIVEVIVEG